MPGMHRALVKSAAAANMNLLRIWGGGVYIYEEFTDACDEEGVMVYEDMMYGTDGIMPGEQWMLSHSNIRAMRAVSLLIRCLCCTATWRLWGVLPGATATSDQEAELRYQIRRQAHHPAIIGWCGCNECGGHGPYTDFVMTTVASEDNSRVIRSSSPFGLYSSGVNTLTGLPNGQKLVDIPLSAEKPKDGSPWPAGAEQHGPYQHGGIFPAINSGGGFIDKPPLVVGVQPGAFTAIIRCCCVPIFCICEFCIVSFKSHYSLGGFTCGTNCDMIVQATLSDPLNLDTQRRRLAARRSLRLRVWPRH